MVIINLGLKILKTAVHEALISLQFPPQQFQLFTYLRFSLMM